MLLTVPVKRSTMIKVGIAFSFTAVALVVLVVVFCVRGVRSESLVDFYEKFILSETQKALHYELNENASRYQASDSEIIDFGNYDFVIVGAGSAGAVVANRLSEVGYWNILLLEAGTFPNNLTEIPSLYVFGCFSDYNWGLKSVPQTTACLGTVQQRCMVSKGRGVGGSTLLNGLIYSRGHHIDFNKWADLVNDSSWSYDNVLPYFKKSEDFQPTDPNAPADYAYHGTGGYWNVENHQPSIPFQDVLLDANRELGYNFTDYNGRERLGASVVQYNTIKGKRHDQATAFLFPVMYRSNLKIQSESYVTKIEIDNATKEATAVLFTHQGATYRAAVNKEVILSAGAISSPQILILSGIGPQQHLDELNIPVIQNLSVGLSLRDHTGVFGIQFTSNMTAPNSTLREAIEDYLKGIGPLTSNTESHVLGWYKSSVEEVPDYPDLELVTDLSSENSELGRKFMGWDDETWNSIWRNRTSFYLNMVLLHAQSLGSVKLKSSNPFDYPLIDFNLLSDPYNKDLDALYKGIQFCLSLANTTAFKAIGAQFDRSTLPACSHLEYLSKKYWYCYMRYLGVPVFHTVGTCPVGEDPKEGAVVDSSLKVFGVQKLRVVDASVFPFTLSSHPSADCAMVGEKVSDEIKLEYGEK